MQYVCTHRREPQQKCQGQRPGRIRQAPATFVRRWCEVTIVLMILRHTLPNAGFVVLEQARINYGIPAYDHVKQV